MSRLCSHSFRVLPFGLALMFLPLACDSSGGGGEEGTSLSEKVDEYVRPYQELSFFDGTVLVARGGKILYEKAYGMADYASQVPNTTDTQYRVASLAKPFTELAAGKLIEAGAMSRSTTVDVFIPDFNRGGEISVGELLDNTSGIPHINDLPWYDEFESHDYSLEELIDRFKSDPLDFEPGSQFAYSNGGYAVLAYIIEKASGMGYADYVDQEIVAPLGMTASGVDRRDLTLPERATGHYPGTTTLSERVPAPYLEISIKTGGGAFYATVDDLYRFSEGLYSDNVVSTETYDMLFPPEGSIAFFSGRQPGFNAVLRKDLQNDVTVVLLSNNYAAGMLQSMAEAFSGMVLGRAYDPPLVSGEVDVPQSTLSAYAGMYLVPGGDTVELSVSNGILASVEDGTVEELLVPVDPTHFILRITWAEVSFLKDSGGAVNGAHVRFLVDGQELTITRQ